MALIMIVDDEEDACRLSTRILTAQGHEVQAFATGEEAIQWLRDATPDLAVLDIKLRGMDGISVLEHVRQLGRSTRVILITGYPAARSTQRAMELGVEGILVKPVEIDEFERLVNRALVVHEQRC
jgi:two-component system, response regulator, stage 0 sporulation protein F